MSPLQLVVVAVLQGAAEALPVSPSGHAAVARLWLVRADAGTAIDAALKLATALALGLAARRRLAAAFGDGVRAVARPALFQASPGARDAAVLLIASAASLATARLVAPRIEGLRDAPIAVGLGLIAAGLAVFPGASRVGAALTVLLWLGVRADRAVDLALLITVPSLLFGAAKESVGATIPGAFEPGALVIGVVIAFLAARLATVALRSLVVRGRLPALALWIIPLGFALLAYARALPASGT